MRSAPVILSEHQDYFVVNDSHIPTPSKENIILKPSGLAIIAQLYFQKYGVVIRICGEFLKINRLAEKIRDYVCAAKNQFPAAQKICFIFISNDDPDDIFGHALPMIWQKEGAQEHLFFLDTTQYLGETGAVKPGIREFRLQLLSLMPNLKLWSIFGRRQIDYSSCYTDALVVLRDGLRVPSFMSCLDNKIKEHSDDISIFYVPEFLLRSAQTGSYPEKSNADLECVIRTRCERNEKKSETLGEFRHRFSASVDVNGKAKQFCLFTLCKAKQYATTIESCVLSL